MWQPRHGRRLIVMPTSESKRDVTVDEILHPPDYRPRALHFALVLTELLSRIPPLLLLPAWLALTAIACWPWGPLRIPAAGISLAFMALDGAGLALLPRLNRSFGPVTPSLLTLTLVRVCLTFGGGVVWGDAPALIAIGMAQMAITAVSIYATWVEPFRVGVTHESLHSPKLNDQTELRLLHISDLHIERITPREQRLLDLVERLNPDLVVLTGDYLNLSSVRDPESQEEARDLLARICERCRGPVYAVTGSPPVDLKEVVPRIFDGLPILWLLDEVAEVEIGDQSLCIAGLRCTRERSRDAPRLRHLLADVPADSFTLLLYHSPDLMPEAVESGVDLYVCGHTHGGQIRLPFFGALITSSAFWKRYEMGRYEERGTTLYVSRGLGMEGLGAPRARFLSPPEIIEWTLSGADDGTHCSGN